MVTYLMLLLDYTFNGEVKIGVEVLALKLKHLHVQGRMFYSFPFAVSPPRFAFYRLVVDSTPLHVVHPFTNRPHYGMS